MKDTSNHHTELAIDATGLVKSYGDMRAVDGIDLKVERGSIFSVLGPNGAGKTTTVRMLATLIKVDAGSARLLGFDVKKQAQEVRRRISLTGQFASVDEDLTGFENLVLLARLLGMPRSEAKSRATELLRSFELEEAANKQLKSFSGGMRRRLDIASSIIRTPELLFLDEPTTGLDPRSRNQVWDIIRGLVAKGTTVLLTTQYLEEADQLADRIAVIDHGKVIAEGTSAELKRSVGGGVLHVRVVDATKRDYAKQVLTEQLDEHVHDGDDPSSITSRISDPARAAAALAQLTSLGVEISDFSVGQPSLDEVFFELTGDKVDSKNTAEALQSSQEGRS
jgi:ABC-2 type transport system ATP-binding protein